MNNFDMEANSRKELLTSFKKAYGKILEENAESGKWLDWRRFGGNVSEDELRSWIGSLK